MGQQQKSEHQQFQDYLKLKRNKVEDMELNARFQIAENTTMEYAIRNEEIREKYLKVADIVKQRDIVNAAKLEAVTEQPVSSTEEDVKPEEVTDVK